VLREPPELWLCFGLDQHDHPRGEEQAGEGREAAGESEGTGPAYTFQDEERPHADHAADRAADYLVRNGRGVHPF